MGDKVPKKKSSGNSDAHKAKQAKNQAERPAPPTEQKGKKK